MELLVGVLGASEIFGEVAILDPERPSPVTVIAYTNIECYVMSVELLRDKKIEAQYKVPMLQHLNRSMMMNNPHPAKLAHLYGDRFLWDKQKAVVLKELMPESWTRAHEQLLLKQKRDIIENREEERDLMDVTGAHHTADVFIENGHKLKHKANKPRSDDGIEKAALYALAAEQYKRQWASRTSTSSPYITSPLRTSNVLSTKKRLSCAKSACLSTRRAVQATKVTNLVTQNQAQCIF